MGLFNLLQNLVIFFNFVIIFNMYNDSNALKIWVDGSAFKNPGGESGLAGFVEYPDFMNKNPEIAFKESFKESTNNRMELKACIFAYRFIKKNYSQWKFQGIHRFQIITDSKYVFDNKHRSYYWRKAGWVNLEGKPIENIDLWREFLSVSNSVNVELAWHEGKTNEINKLVDKLAKEMAKSLLKRIDLGFRPGKVSRSKLIGVASPFPANGQSEIIKVYKYESEGVGKNKQLKVSFLLQSVSSKLPAGKYYAYLKTKEFNISRHQHYSVIFGTNNKYPTIESISESED